jgi:transposase-like protein
MNQSTSKTDLGAVKSPCPHYDEAFRRSAIEHYHRHNGTLKRTAQELGINYWTLRGWIRAERAQQAPPPAVRNLSEAEAEIARLRADLARVTEQRDILKKSLGILSHT